MGFWSELGHIGSWIADPLGNAFGIKGAGDVASGDFWDIPADVHSDWVAFKHLVTPDMRRDREVQVQSASNARNIVYGRSRVGNQLAYAETSGDKNQVFHIICIHAGHEIDGYEEIYFDDKLAATISPITGCTIHAPYVGKATIEFFDGAQTWSSYGMTTASAGGWTSAHKLLGVAYTHVTLTYDETVFPAGMPVVKAVIRGKKVFDPLTGLIAWSSNPALCIRDYCLTPVDLGGMGCDPDEINETSFATAANICDQTVYSNIPPNQAPGVKTLYKPIPGVDPSCPETRYTINGSFKLDGAPTQFIKDMLTSCAGDAVYSQGQWKIFAGAPTEPVATIDESWLNGGISFQVGANKNDKVNTAKGVFTNSNDYWADTEFPSVPVGASTPPNSAYWDIWGTPNQYNPAATYAINDYVALAGKVYQAYAAVPVNTPPPSASYWVLIEEHDSGATYLTGHVVQRSGTVYQANTTVPASNPYIAEDGGEVLTANLTLPFTISSSEAQRLAKIAVEKSRRGLSVSYPCNHRAFRLDVMDVVAVNNARLGWSGKLFKVTSWPFSFMGGIALTLAEYDAAIWDWAPGDSTPLVPPIMTNLPDPWTVRNPTNLTVSEYLYFGNVASILMTKAVFSWDTGDAQSSLFDIYMDGTYLLTSRDTSIEIGDVATGIHVFSVISTNTLGAKSDMVSITYNVVGKTAPPLDVEDFRVAPQQDGTRAFSWGIANPPLDLAGYVIKFKRGSESAWVNMVPLHSGLLPGSPFETNQLPAGDYIFAIKAVDTTGNESLHAKYITTTLPDPRLANVWVSASQSYNGWDGVKTDCVVNNEGNLEANCLSTWDTLPATWGLYSQWNNNPVASFTYESPSLDMGMVLGFNPRAEVFGIGAFTVEMATSLNGSTWSSWVPLDKVDARYIKIRITVDTASGVMGLLSEVLIYLIVKPIIEELNDVDTSALTGAHRIGTGDVRLPIIGAYSLIKQVSVTLQNVGPGWSWELIDKNLTYGPRIKIYNSSNALADAVIDAYIKGI